MPGFDRASFFPAGPIPHLEIISLKYTKLTIFYLPQTGQVENSYLYDNQLLHLQTVIHLLMVKPFHGVFAGRLVCIAVADMKGLHQQQVAKT